MAQISRKYQAQYSKFREVVEIIKMAGERDEIGGVSINPTNPEVIYEDKCSIESVGAKEMKWLGTTEQRITHTCQIRQVKAYPILMSYHLRLKYEPLRVFAIVAKTDSSHRGRTFTLMLEELPNKL